MWIVLNYSCARGVTTVLASFIPQIECNTLFRSSFSRFAEKALFVDTLYHTSSSVYHTTGALQLDDTQA